MIRRWLHRLRCQHPEWINHHLGVQECASCGKVKVEPGPR